MEKRVNPFKPVYDIANQEQILEQIAPYKTPVRFIRWGEPLLHPKLVEYISDIKSIGSIAHINTNGSMLNEKMICRLLDCGLDSIKFSFQGVDRYESKG